MHSNEVKLGSAVIVLLHIGSSEIESESQLYLNLSEYCKPSSVAAVNQSETDMKTTYDHGIRFKMCLAENDFKLQ